MRFSAENWVGGPSGEEGGTTHSSTDNDRARVPESGSILFVEGYGARENVGGYLFSAADEYGSEIQLSQANGKNLEASPTAAFCATGRTGKVKDGEFGKHWGALIGWNLNQAKGSSDAGAYKQGAVKGFSFRLSLREEHTSLLRVGVRTGDSDYCVEVKPGRNRIEWGDLRRNCWEKGGESLVPAVAAFESIKWQAVAVAHRDGPVNFCIDELEALL